MVRKDKKLHLLTYLFHVFQLYFNFKQGFLPLKVECHLRKGSSAFPPPPPPSSVWIFYSVSKYVALTGTHCHFLLDCPGGPGGSLSPTPSRPATIQDTSQITGNCGSIGFAEESNCGCTVKTWPQEVTAVFPACKMAVLET